MTEKNANRTRIIGLRLSTDEYTRLEKKWKVSNCPKLSEYARKKLFDRPIIASYRNESLDDFMQEMMVLRKALEISNNSYGQSMNRLYLLDKKADVATWIKIHDIEKQTLMSRIEDIKNKINKIADQWLLE